MKATADSGSAPSSTVSDAAIAEKTAALAAAILERAGRAGTKPERMESARLAAMMADPAGKPFTMALADRIFRSGRTTRAAAAFRSIVKSTGVPVFLNGVERILVRAVVALSVFFPAPVVSAIRRKLRIDSRRVILSAEPRPLHRYLAGRVRDGTRVNLNQLGEAILGEEEAERRMEAILALLARPDVNYISVKISAIFSQIQLTAWDETLAGIMARLRRLYRAALPARKFVNLDMEEYRDLHLTLTAFKEVLTEPEFRAMSAGIVLQAYLPDSWDALQGLTTWSMARTAAGGAPVKVRLVKGANLAMETVEAELHGWNIAPYICKPDTDANFKRMLDFATRPEHTASLRVGVASHNVFDVALAIVLSRERGVEAGVEIEMLEGMAPPLARVVREESGGLLVYAPVVRDNDFPSALAYLVRRLEENTTEGNFLRDVFGLTPGSAAWTHHREAFLTAWRERHKVEAEPRRARLPAASGSGFRNAPDTDWTQAAARSEVHAAIALRSAPELPATLLPAAEVLAIAEAARPAWEASGSAARAAILLTLAEVMTRQHMASIAHLVHEGKKTIPEADAEVSEAIDFARYYAQAFAALKLPPAGVQVNACGTVVVAPPWNFPYAIPAGGVLAALAAGNTVILKPAPEVREVCAHLAAQLWEAGIPREVLQFYPCADDDNGRALLTDAMTSAVVLTGAWETAQLFLKWKPSMNLLAETSGKNSIIITAQADRDLAARDLVRSAFGHAGQKCSAASLGILEDEVYDDPGFLRQLRDAARSLACGPSTIPTSMVTPLMREAGGPLLRALTELSPGESWLLEPKQDPADRCLWSPGIKLGIQPGSWFHTTECFGPVLGLMRAADMRQAIALQNATPYGLTAGIHSLDAGEIQHWKEHAHAGNLYINRPITGAIVQRQPFGGWKRSCIGPGAKAGGPNYVLHFCRITCSADIAPDFASAWAETFARETDPSGLRAESNIFRYHAVPCVVLRLRQPDAGALALARLAAETCGVRLEISLGTEESEAGLVSRLSLLNAEGGFLRTVEPPGDELLAAARAAGLNWIDAPLLPIGRLELPRWLREQAISETLHRYGNVSRPAARPS